MYYTFDDGRFTFWTAEYGAGTNREHEVFRVREDTTPERRATRKRILSYDRLRPSSPAEIQSWVTAHPMYKLLVARGRHAGRSRE